MSSASCFHAAAKGDDAKLSQAYEEVVDLHPQAAHGEERLEEYVMQHLQNLQDDAVSAADDL